MCVWVCVLENRWKEQQRNSARKNKRKGALRKNAAGGSRSFVFRGHEEDVEDQGVFYNAFILNQLEYALSNS
jgi:hypothetical protein